MKTNKPFKFAAILLIALPLVVVVLRLSNAFEPSTGQYYQLHVSATTDNSQKDDLVDQIEKSNPKLVAQEANPQDREVSDNTNAIKYVYEAEPTTFTIDPDLPFQSVIQPYVQDFVGEGSLYPVGNPKMVALAVAQKGQAQNVLPVMQALFKKADLLSASELAAFAAILQIPTEYHADDFLRSAYLATMCRIIHLPARVVQGLEPAEAGSTTWRYWTEVRIAHLWVPFVPGMGHFASLPARFVKIFNNAEQFDNWKHNSAVKFELEHVMVKPDKPRFFTLIDMQRISTHTGIPQNRLALILLLPLAALVVCIFKIIVGVKTMGIFLPALIALTLIDTGLWQGLLLFTGMVVVVSTLHIPLSRWGIQYNAKLALMLTAVVGVALVILSLGTALGSGGAASPLFFPFVILTIVSERVAAKADEAGLKTALSLYGGTMLVTCIVYFIVDTLTLQVFFLENPEMIFSVAGIMLLLGKWIGMRVTEYYRFYKLSQA